MKRFSLDTNILADLIRNPAGVVAQHIAEVGEARVAVSIVVACELLIAAQAKALGMTVVTDNHGEFRRVPGLDAVNWLREP